MSRRTDHLEIVRADLTIAADLLPDAIARLNDGRLGTPRAASGSGSRGGSSSSTVERAVLGVDCPHDDESEDCTCNPDTTPDPARARLAEVDKILNRMGRDAARLRQIASTAHPHAPTDRDRREVAKANLIPEPGCDHHQAAGIFEPIHATGTVSDTLTLPMALCEFCYREVRRKGVLPRGEVLVARHHKGKDPRVPA